MIIWCQKIKEKSRQLSDLPFRNLSCRWCRVCCKRWETACGRKRAGWRDDWIVRTRRWMFSYRAYKRRLCSREWMRSRGSGWTIEFRPWRESRPARDSRSPSKSFAGREWCGNGGPESSDPGSAQNTCGGGGGVLGCRCLKNCDNEFQPSIA